MKKLFLSTIFSGFLAHSLMASDLPKLDNIFDDVFVGGGVLTSQIHKTSSGTMEFTQDTKNFNFFGKAGLILDDYIRVYGQMGNLYSSVKTDFDYTSYSGNIEVDLANKYGWKPFVGVHAGIGVATKLDDNNVSRENIGLEYGMQAGIRKQITEWIEAEGGYRWTKQSTELTTSTGHIKNNYTASFYSSLNILF